MKLNTAIEILDYHQEWRLGKREDMIHEPKKLTEALDVVLNKVKHNIVGQSEQLGCEHDWQSVFHHDNLIGRYCPECKELRAD